MGSSLTRLGWDEAEGRLLPLSFSSAEERRLVLLNRKSPPGEKGRCFDWCLLGLWRLPCIVDYYMS